MTNASFAYPVTSQDTAPFWEGLRRRELRYQWCDRCQRPVFHPRAACPYCWNAGLAWRQSIGQGRVYSFSETWDAKTSACRIFGIAHMAEGFFIFGELQAQPGRVTIGAALTTVFDDLAADLTLARFQLMD